MQIRQHIGNTYQRIFPEAFLSEEIVETKADCQNCYKAERGEYKPELKCCTYQPYLANYLCGSLLLSSNTEGIRRFEQAISENQYALPIGLCASPDYQWRHQEAGLELYGQKEDLLCSFYDEGKCSIWGYRSSVCAGFYCTSSFGASGLEFWEKLTSMMSDLERELAQYILGRLCFSEDSIEKNLKAITFAEPGRESLSEGERQQYWGDYYGKELSFYKQAFEIFSELREEDLPGLLGNELQKERLEIISLAKEFSEK